MKLKIVQAGDPILRQVAQPLSSLDIVSRSVQQLIELMRETMRDAPSVGLAAPQVGESIQLIVIEDRPEYLKDIPPDRLAERGRSTLPFHVIANPSLSIVDTDQAVFFEGCLSVTGFVALTPRAKSVKVTGLDGQARPISITAHGWYARILQHEIDHLNGYLYLDWMLPRSFMTSANYARYWQDTSIHDACLDLGIHPAGRTD
jgi:peptide deformylase